MSTRDTDQRIWQRRTVKLLAGLLTVRDLPILEWTITDAGALLTGKVKLGDYAGRDGRAAGAADFETWRRHLGAETVSDYMSMGTRHVVAIVRDYDGLVDVRIMADLPSDDDIADQEAIDAHRAPDEEPTT